MFRQVLRHSVNPLLHPGSSRTQPIARAYHHAHCFWRPPHPPSHRCIRRYVPIQTASALLQQYHSCQSKCDGSHPSSRSFHTTQRVQGSPLFGFLVAFKVCPQLSCGGVDTHTPPIVICRARDYSNRWSCCTHFYPCSSSKKPCVTQDPQENRVTQERIGRQCSPEPRERVRGKEG